MCRAWTYRWGATWYLHTAVPSFESLVGPAPEPRYVTVLPFAARLRLLDAFVLDVLFTFSRRVPLVSVPLGDLWRPNELVVRNRQGRAGS